MLFFLHVLLFVYGLAGLVLGHLRVSNVWESSPSRVFELVEKFYPSHVFQVWKPGVVEAVPDLTRNHVISGGLALYALRFLFSRHRA
jgi:hypothetical protein